VRGSGVWRLCHGRELALVSSRQLKGHGPRAKRARAEDGGAALSGPTRPSGLRRERAIEQQASEVGGGGAAAAAVAAPAGSSTTQVPRV
jgi:hypothetical protein